MNIQNWFFFLSQLRKNIVSSSDSALQHNWAEKAEIAFSISDLLYMAIR